MNTTHKRPKPPRKWQHAIAPRCVECRGIHLRVYKSIQMGDSEDSDRTQYTRCTDCGARFLVQVEYNPLV